MLQQHDFDQVLPAPDIARQLGLADYDVRNLARSGKLTAHREGGRVCYRLGDVLAVSAARSLRPLRRMAAATA